METFVIETAAAQYKPIEEQITDLIQEVEAVEGNVDKVVDPALIKGGEIILDGMKQLVPVYDPSDPKNKRRRAPWVPVVGFIKNAMTVWNPYRNKKRKATVRVGFDFNAVPVALYGLYQEFGRKSGIDKRGRKIGFMPPKPFVRPALAIKQEEAMQVAKEAFEEALDKTFGGK